MSVQDICVSRTVGVLALRVEVLGCSCLGRRKNIFLKSVLYLDG